MNKQTYHIYPECADCRLSSCTISAGNMGCSNPKVHDRLFPPTPIVINFGSEVVEVESLKAQFRQAQAEANSYHQLCEAYLATLKERDNQIWQAEAREAALREALENLFEAIKDDETVSHVVDIARWNAHAALSSPSHSSRYREALAVVEAAKEFLNNIANKDYWLSVDKLRDALTVYNKTGEGAGE